MPLRKLPSDVTVLIPQIEQDVAFVYTFKDSKIIGWDAYFTFDEALEAAGLSE